MTTIHSIIRNLTVRRAALGLAVVFVLLVLPLIVFADNVQNDVVVGGNDTFTLGGFTKVNYRIASNNGDGQNGCNAADTTSATVTINTPANVTATPPSLNFVSCGVFKETTFTATAAGNYEITVSVSDSGPGTYNTSPAKFTLKVLAPTDTTPPTITPNVSGTVGNNGWYTSDVNVSWTVSELDSPATLVTDGCDPMTIDYDTMGVTLTCTATSAGGTNTQSVTIKRDATKPTISGDQSPAANVYGWNNSDVTVSFTCSDATSGVASCGADQTLSSEGAGQSVTGNVIDYAGHTNSATVSGINIDKTAPEITPNVIGTVGNNGWYTSDVTVSWTVTDGLSGVIKSSGCDPMTISSDTQGTLLTCSATNAAGGTNSQSVTIKRDTTKPTISGSASPAANGNGWNNSDVTVSFTCSDATSGVASCGPNQTLSSEGAGQSVTGNADDNAGNTNSDTVSSINIDRTAPVVSVTGVSNTTYTLGSVPTAGCSTTDALSDVDTYATLAITGGNGNGLGSFTATCSGATDKAGNVAADVSATFSVVYKWAGFFQPVDNFGFNMAKAGSAIPVKFSLAGYQGLNIFATGYPKVNTIRCDASQPSDPIEETVTAGQSGLNYDAAADQYIYVWKTVKAWTGCRQLLVMLNDGTMHTALFQFK